MMMIVNCFKMMISMKPRSVSLLVVVVANKLHAILPDPYGDDDCYDDDDDGDDHFHIHDYDDHLNDAKVSVTVGGDHHTA